MSRESVTVDEAISLLNEAIALDTDAMTALVGARVECNRALAGHSTIQTFGPADPDPPAVPPTQGYRVGLLGILNGLFGIRENGWGEITARFDEGRLVCFQRTKHDVRA
jgi:hypothetical protein